MRQINSPEQFDEGVVPERAIATGAVTEAKIGDGSVSRGKMGIDFLGKWVNPPISGVITPGLGGYRKGDFTYIAPHLYVCVSNVPPYWVRFSVSDTW